MAIELKIPEVGESIQEVQIGKWLRGEGEGAELDDGVVEIETDKISFELPAPVTGVVTKLLKAEGESAVVGEVIGYMEEGEAAPKAKAPAAADAAAPAAPESHVMPSAKRVLAQGGVSAAQAVATGPGGRILKEDAQRAVAGAAAPAPARASAPASAPDQPELLEEAVPLSPLRKRIAERLVEAQQTAALLTTFNEIDMSAVMALRARHKEKFFEKYDVKLGFMSFFVKAVIDALKLVPRVNAEMRDDDIVFKNHYDIGVAVGGGKGLVVPVLRNADRLSFAEVEQRIADLAARAMSGKLDLPELQGGTFTISNGGVYGSLLSTPIVNPPQSGILGLHAIQERPVGRDGQIVLAPMMYVALTYDHRIIDGREAVTFLKRVKECVEAPDRMLLEI